ncbi:MAG: glutamate--cysteine ligase [Deltaproteobacteria bacterium]|nr:glutamate--cysteine ligase [Deltaproteobacteria bacterium]
MSKMHTLFSVYGIEAEYMIVDKDSLNVLPIADKILAQLNGGTITNEVEQGSVAWSNELVNHVLEIKCAHPVQSIVGMDEVFHTSILQINALLAQYNAVLMPTAMHPWFEPSQMQLWPHGQREIYHLYHEIFDCRGHGWSNLQSVHINLPYANEEEFKLLHSAIRVVLPMIPYFAASSPYFDAQKGDLADNRLAFYEKNQIKVPSIIGNIIPEFVENTQQYHKILQGIYKDIAHYDHAKTLQNPWLNSRAAIPKFDVGAIEIRLMDIQESPYMDFCIVSLITCIIEQLIQDTSKHTRMFLASDKLLRKVYDASKTYEPQIDAKEYFEIFKLSDCYNWTDFIKELVNIHTSYVNKRYHRGLEVLLQKGNLAKRLTQKQLSKEMYKKLVTCLFENNIYV